MSSFRNAMPQRQYKERAQPQERSRLGLLEKHKDYSLRAKNYKAKQKVLKSLKEKAAGANLEDEFSYGMLSRSGSFNTNSGKRWSGKVHGDRGNTSLSVDTVRLLKTQDMGYLRTVRSHLAKEVSQLEERAIMAGALSGNAGEDDDTTNVRRPENPQKIVYVDADQQMDGVEDGPEVEDGDSEGFGGFSEDESDLKAERAARLQRKLQNARTRLKALTGAEQELDLQRARMAKTPTIGGITKGGRKFKVRARKR